MTTGLIYAALFYVASLILAAIAGFLIFPGDELKALDVFSNVARWIGPTLMVPAGFVVGFFREQRNLRRQQELEAQAERERQRQSAAHRMRETPTMGQSMAAAQQGQDESASVESESTSSPEEAPSPQESTPEHAGRSEMSEEVKEFLKQTSRVDLKGIKDFIEETRRHRVKDAGNEEPG